MPLLQGDAVSIFNICDKMAHYWSAVLLDLFCAGQMNKIWFWVLILEVLPPTWTPLFHPLHPQWGASTLSQDVEHHYNRWRASLRLTV